MATPEEVLRSLTVQEGGIPITLSDGSTVHLRPDIQVGLKVNDEDRKERLQDTIAHRQKNEAGEEKLRKAAEAQKEAASAVSFYQSIVSGIRRGDTEAMRRTLGVLGLPPETVERVSAAVSPSFPGLPGSPRKLASGKPKEDIDDLLDLDSLDADGDDRGEGRPQMSQEDVKKVLAGYLGVDPKDLQEVVSAFRQAQTSTKEKHFRGLVDRAVDSDEELAKILSGRGKTIAEILREKSYDLVSGRMRQGSPWEIALRDGLKELRTALKEDAAISAERVPAVPGGVAGLGSADSGGQLPIYPDTPVERVPVTDPKWVERFVAEGLQREAKANAGQ